MRIVQKRIWNIAFLATAGIAVLLNPSAPWDYAIFTALCLYGICWQWKRRYKPEEEDEKHSVFPN